MKDQAPEPRKDFTTGDGLMELEAYVQGRLSGQVRDFRLVAVENGVIMSGHARCYYAKQLAQHYVMEAAAISIVANEIEVF